MLSQQNMTVCICVLDLLLFLFFFGKYCWSYKTALIIPPGNHEMDTQTQYYISITPMIQKGTIKISVFLVNAVIDFSPENINGNMTKS